MCHCTNLYHINNNNYNYNCLVRYFCLTTMRYSAHTICISTNTCSSDLYIGDLQTTTVLFTRKVSSHTTDWITTNSLSSVLSCPFLIQHNQNFRYVLGAERPCSRLLDNSIATSFLFVYNAHSCCFRLRCAFVTYLFHTHTDIVVGLLITGSMYICGVVNVAFVLSFLMLNNIRSFPFA